jgi:hypothetical protein
MNRLTISDGPHQGRRFSLRDPEISLGRGAQAGIHLDDPEVDEVHLILLQQGDQLCIGSISPDPLVLINGSQAEEGTLLQPGDELQVGNTRLVFTNAKLHTGMSARRTGKMHRVTVGAIVMVLILETLFILGFSLYRRDKASLESLRQAAQTMKEEQASPEESGTFELSPPVLSIRKGESSYVFDDQNSFQICLFRLDFDSQRELIDEELKQLRVEGRFLEKVGTNAWSELTAYTPSSNWPVHQRDQRRDRFFCLTTVLLPLDPLISAEDAEVLYEEKVIAGSLRLYFGNELQDEKKVELHLQDRVLPQPPTA